MEYYYCDSCSIITMYRNNTLDVLSQYKKQFHIARVQLDELSYPKGIREAAEKNLTIDDITIEILSKTQEIRNAHTALSTYDALALSCSIFNNYCLVTNDKKLINVCKIYRIPCTTCEEIREKFIRREIRRKRN